MSIRDLIPWRRGERNLVRRQGDNDSFPVLQNEINRLFDDFFRNLYAPTAEFLEESGAFVPTVDVKENDREVLVKAELPGIDEKDVEVSFEKGVLSLKGEKREEKEERDAQYYHVERHFGSFFRRIPLDADIDEDKISARFKKGVLEIRLPKLDSEKNKRRRIEIK